jgi:fibronectin type 3 domain-containing protein
VSWNAVPGATCYEIRVGDDPNYFFKKTITPSTSHCNYDLDPGKLYYYWVRAKNSVDEGDLSSPYETGYQRLDEPNNVEATDGIYCDRVRVTWDSVEGATSYKVRRLTDSGWDQEWHVPSGTTYDDYSAIPSIVYFYRVTACAEVGCGEWIASDSGYRGAPPATEEINATDGIFLHKVRVTWEAVEGASSYRLQRAVVGESYETMVDGLTTTQYDDTDVVQGTTYYYRVAACNSCGCGAYRSDTGWAQVSTPTPTPTPTAGESVYLPLILIGA